MAEDTEDQDRPWTEAQWEKMMRESDLRSARFGELLETLMDHPERDVLVAREMGWTELTGALEQNPASEDYEYDDEEVPMTSDTLDLGRDDDLDSLLDDETDREVKKIPAYAISDTAAHAVMEALKPYQKIDESEMDEVAGELIGEAFIGIHVSCAKISGGHTMGYDDDVLCGNIVKNKLALDGARQSIRAFEELRPMGIVPVDVIDNLLPLLRDAETAIQARIAELRGKVWWD